MLRLGCILFTLGVLIAAPRSHAQGPISEFLPEIDVYYAVPHDLTAWFQVKNTYENGSQSQAELGPSLIYAPKKRWLRFPDPNTTVEFALGYRYLASPDRSGTDRMQPVVTFSLPVWKRLRMSDRNRADLDWQNGRFNWTYRNRLELALPVSFGHYKATPYASAEFFYKSEYGKWSDTAIYAGCLFPIRKHVVLNPYYEHQNFTGRAPNEVYNQVGLVLNLYFHAPGAP